MGKYDPNTDASDIVTTGIVVNEKVASHGSGASIAIGGNGSVDDPSSLGGNSNDYAIAAVDGRVKLHMQRYAHNDDHRIPREQTHNKVDHVIAADLALCQTRVNDKINEMEDMPSEIALWMNESTSQMHQPKKTTQNSFDVQDTASLKGDAEIESRFANHRVRLGKLRSALSALSVNSSRAETRQATPLSPQPAPEVLTSEPRSA